MEDPPPIDGGLESAKGSSHALPDRNQPAHAVRWEVDHRARNVHQTLSRQRWHNRGCRDSGGDFKQMSEAARNSWMLIALVPPRPDPPENPNSVRRKHIQVPRSISRKDERHDRRTSPGCGFQACPQLAIRDVPRTARITPYHV